MYLSYQINNQHIFTIVFHFLHILFLQDLLIHSFFPFHMFDHHLAKGLSLSSVHVSGIHSLLIPETRLLYQYSVPGSKHTSSKLLSLPRLFPISLDCLPGFDSCYSHFMPYRMTPSVRHRVIEVYYYYYYYTVYKSGGIGIPWYCKRTIDWRSTWRKMFERC